MKVNSISDSMNRIHLIITRSLNISIEYSKELINAPLNGVQYSHGFINYVHCLIVVLDAHHRIEDEIAFPYLQQKITDVPYSILSKQHEEIVELLEEAKQSLSQIRSGNIGKEVFQKLYDILCMINKIWLPHIKLEEEMLPDEKITMKINREEQERLSKMFSEQSKKHSQPDFLVLPFLLFNLPKPQRKYFTKGIPALITNELVPFVWKEKWESMKPFLLN